MLMILQTFTMQFQNVSAGGAITFKKILQQKKRWDFFGILYESAVQKKKAGFVVFHESKWSKNSHLCSEIVF